MTADPVDNNTCDITLKYTTARLNSYHSSAIHDTKPSRPMPDLKDRISAT